MTEDHLAGLWTLIAMIAFLGVCFWAYSGRRKQDFDEAANLPFADDEPDGNNDHGGSDSPNGNSKGGSHRQAVISHR